MLFLHACTIVPYTLHWWPPLHRRLPWPEPRCLHGVIQFFLADARRKMCCCNAQITLNHRNKDDSRKEIASTKRSDHFRKVFSSPPQRRLRFVLPCHTPSRSTRPTWDACISHRRYFFQRLNVSRWCSKALAVSHNGSSTGDQVVYWKEGLRKGVIEVGIRIYSTNKDLRWKKRRIGHDRNWPRPKTRRRRRGGGDRSS
mgnify:CR=1 FL=1